MPRAISEDLRKRVVAAVELGEPVRSVAARYDVAVSSVVKWSQRYRKHGHVRPARIGGYRPRTLDPWRAWLERRLSEEPHLTLERLRVELAAQKVHVSQNTIWRYVRHQLGLSFKKKPSGQ